MPDMEKGFYCLGHEIFYGMYPRSQASSRFPIQEADAKLITTDVLHSEDYEAVRFWDNHAATEQELKNMKQAFQKIMECLNVSNAKEPNFEETEKRLGIILPQEIKVLYSALSGLSDFTSGAERFLPLEELYIEDENLVFYKIKRTPAALSLRDGVLMNYHKKQWSYSRGGESFLNYVLDRFVVKAICQMPISQKGKIKGELRTTLGPKQVLSEIYGEKFQIMEEYRNYGNIILLSKNGALGWFRQNGFYSDILIGCLNNTILKELLSANLPADWE